MDDAAHAAAAAPASGAAAAPAPARLSVIVITRNEAHRLGACLASVPFADEVVVVDSGSTDGTQALAARLGARVVETADWPGFGAQKNRALDAAGGDWVLSLDADERVTTELAAQIRAVVAGDATAGAPAAWTLSRLSSLAGRWVRHGDWYPDPVLRLFRRGAARFSDDLVHERVVFEGTPGRLDGHLLHDSMPTLDDLLAKLNRYSGERALQMRRRGRAGGLGKAIGHGAWAFLRSYLLKRGFLDGAVGFVVAVSIAEGTYYSYLKAWLRPGED